MKLFGLIESIQVQSVFLIPEHLPVPHQKLFEKLEEYSSGLSVGLQIDSSRKRLKMKPLILENQKIYLDLYTHFIERGNQVHFLETRDYFIGLNEITKRLIPLKKQLKKAKGEEKRKLYQEFDKLAIEIEYGLVIGIENPILQRIAQYKPDLVFIGDGHARRFYNRRSDLLSPHGIEIEEYWRDKIDKGIDFEDLRMAALMADEERPMEYWLEGKLETDLQKVESGEQVTEDGRSMKTERLYRAVKEGRVTKGNPHYIGTWHPVLEHRGLFEAYVESFEPKNPVRIEGTIEDCEGSAVFKGEVDSDHIHFTKQYTKSFGEADSGEIEYVGARKNGGYHGTFMSDRINGEFRIQQVRNFETERK